MLGLIDAIVFIHSLLARALLLYAVLLGIWGTYLYFRRAAVTGGFRSSFLMLGAVIAVQGIAAAGRDPSQHEAAGRGTAAGERRQHRYPRRGLLRTVRGKAQSRHGQRRRRGRRRPFVCRLSRLRRDFRKARVKLRGPDKSA